MLIDMTEAKFVELLEQTYKNTNYITKREVPSLNGIADLVAIKVNPKHRQLRSRHQQTTPLLNENFFKLLRLIPDVESKRAPVDINYLEAKTKLSRSYIRTALLDYLESEGYVISTNKKYYKIDGWVPIAEEIIAIEAKLKDWRMGMLQANRYKSFANKVYLAVPPEVESRVDMEALKRFEIGLMVFDAPKNKLKHSYVRSRQRKGINSARLNYVTEFVLAG